MPDHYRDLFLHLGDAVLIEEAGGRIVDANPAAARLLETTHAVLLQKSVSDLLTPPSRERVLPQRDALAPEQHLQIDAQFLTPDGKTVNAVVDVSVMQREQTTIPDTSPLRLLYTLRASTKLDELERELRLQRQGALMGFGNIQHQTFFISSRREISPYPPISPGEPLRPLDWVHTILLGKRLKPALERAWQGETTALAPAWYSPAEGGAWSASYSGILTAIKEGQPRIEHRWLEIAYSPLRGRSGDVSDVCVHVLDRTQERLLSEQARHADLHTASSVLTATLQHEFNNYLSVILAQASSIRMTLGPGVLPSPNLGAITDAAQQAAGLLRRVVDAAMHGNGTLVEIDLNALVVDCANLLPHLVHGRLRVETELAADLPPVRGNRFSLGTMLLCLAREAENSVPHGGRLSIRTYRGQPPYPGLPPSAGIILHDNTGSSSRHEAAVNLNTPLSGESIDTVLARAIAREHRGQIEINRGGKHGRTFEVSLPGLEKQLDLGDRQPAPIVNSNRDVEELEEKFSRAARGHGSDSSVGLHAQQPPAEHVPNQKILIADDEENFRQFASWVLRERGYEVVIAVDGQEAFEKFQEAPSTYNLVILDAYMPRMGGLESYLRMQVLRTDLPVLFASGFARGASVDAIIEGCPGPAGVLLKPFSAEDLVKAVKKALAPAPQDF